jgi:hypothetical protein
MNGKAVALPHSWSLKDWPSAVFPHTESRARYLVRKRLPELMQHRAVARVGRELVVIGAKYDKWLQKQTAAVVGFECNANR